MSAPDATPEISIRDVPEQGRYEASIPGAEDVAAAYYRLRNGTIVFTHTEVPPAFTGRGVGKALARFALDDAARRGLQVIPRCPFMASVVRRYAEYHRLVPDEIRAELGLAADDRAGG